MPFITRSMKLSCKSGLLLPSKRAKPGLRNPDFKRYQNGLVKGSPRSGRYFRKALLTILVPYTGYALYIIAKARDEINEREQQLKNCEDDKAFESTLVKYSPLEILGRFANPFKEYRVLTLFEFSLNRILELFERNRGGIPTDKRSLGLLMPVHKPSWASVESLSSTDDNLKVRILDANEDLGPANIEHTHKPVYSTWLGQSCNMVIYDNFKILTDPLFTDHLIHETLGPKRITPIPAEIEDVPTPDVILVSHNHPDHLDFKSLAFWGSQGKTKPLWIVPKGMGEFMKEHSVDNIIELSWWETAQIAKGSSTYNISCTPAMHWSGRSLVDTNRSLWCSFLFSHNAQPIMFHAGDTGYVWDLFKRISNRYGSGVKLALLPCGQYCPSWHQKPRHISPEEVLKIRDDLKAQNVLGVHWGTFVLSGEYFREPKEKLEMLAEWHGIKSNCYCPELGKTITIN
ncbi:LAQU0S12e03510g1_1 [Lachancea quebecensis]|uniref:LAQU0S12e03510g1_1 n=1 Tax=Lachancea quebecensis TaxID=1654605 RepID=A0A0N7MM29_9SACH|nr:LAQU0S12e03510g1_1 [Lachancea quebecensis]